MNPLTACEEVWPALGLSVGRSCNCGHGCWKLPRLLKLLLLLLAPVAAVSCASNSRQRRPSIDGRTPKAVVRPTLEEEDNNRWRTCPTWWIFKGRSRNFSEAEKKGRVFLNIFCWFYYFLRIHFCFHCSFDVFFFDPQNILSDCDEKLMRFLHEMKSVWHLPIFFC